MFMMHVDFKRYTAGD
jgi:hypothetical protein